MRADRSAGLRKNQYSGKQWTLSMRSMACRNKTIRGAAAPVPGNTPVTHTLYGRIEMTAED